jgi:hypothetical protein
VSKLTTPGAGTAPDQLHAELRALIAASRQRVAAAVNAELTWLYWTVGQRLAAEVLGGERAQYGGRTMAKLGQRLGEEFGRGFEAKNLHRMVQFAQAFPDLEKVASLMRQLSWTHFLQLIPVRTEAARWVYAQQCAEASWSVRELHRQIERKVYERTEIAHAQVSSLPSSTGTTPAQVFKHPYLLDALGLRQVAEYWTELPPKAELERQLHAALVEARERLAGRRLLLGRPEDE